MIVIFSGILISIWPFSSQKMERKILPDANTPSFSFVGEPLSDIFTVGLVPVLSTIPTSLIVHPFSIISSHFAFTRRENIHSDSIFDLIISEFILKILIEWKLRYLPCDSYKAISKFYIRVYLPQETHAGGLGLSRENRYQHNFENLGRHKRLLKVLKHRVA
jgi:hypothetical protein